MSPESAARQIVDLPGAERAPRTTDNPSPPLNGTSVDVPTRVAQYKRIGLTADQTVTALLHRGEIDPHGATRVRQLYAEAPAAPDYSATAGVSPSERAPVPCQETGALPAGDETLLIGLSSGTTGIRRTATTTPTQVQAYREMARDTNGA